MKRPVKEHLFWNLVEPTGFCWLYKGGQTRGGYGNYENHRAHRLAYELLVGSIPEGLQLDHLCRVRLCVNPDHLEPVTPAEHARRSHWGACRRGHPYTEANTYWTRGSRNCRACRALALRRMRARRRL
jgi:hypothetical protein